MTAADTGPADRHALDPVLVTIAESVDLREGPEGVRALLVAIDEAGSRSNKELSRALSIPVPVVVSVLNELRAIGVVERTRPAELTAHGRALLGGPDGGDPPRLDAATIDAICEAVRDDLNHQGRGGSDVNALAPPADVTLDQSHSTVATKVARLRYMLENRHLPTGAIAFVGDDDLMSLTVAMAARHGRRPLADEITVVDSDARVLDFIDRSLQKSGDRAPKVRLVEHDLRDPLPEGLGPHDLAMTDPPYTVAGANLFLTRALELVHRRRGQHVLFSFGVKPPDDQLELQQALTSLGLVITDLRRNFNHYLGAGAIGSVSNLYDLVIGEVVEPSRQRHSGPLYTAETRGSRGRWYRCAGCGHREVVGPGRRFAEIRALQASGCPGCGADSFRPGSKVGDDETPATPTGGGG